jgi:hypothetical protein
MEYLQYQLHVSAFTLAIIRLAFNLSRDYTIYMVYSGGRGNRDLPEVQHTDCLYSFKTNRTKIGWGVSVTPRPLFTPRKTRYPLYRKLGGQQGRSGQVRKISSQDSIPGSSSPLSVAILTTLPGPPIAKALDIIVLYTAQPFRLLYIL